MHKELGLINSSNAVEKHNDLIVSARQKGRGMSWSRSGSNNLVAIKTAAINGQLYLTLSALSAKAAKHPVRFDKYIVADNGSNASKRGCLSMVLQRLMPYGTRARG